MERKASGEAAVPGVTRSPKRQPVRLTGSQRRTLMNECQSPEGAAIDQRMMHRPSEEDVRGLFAHLAAVSGGGAPGSVVGA
jgi:hypothetical protein